jgi:hypothetical protein
LSLSYRSSWSVLFARSSTLSSSNFCSSNSSLTSVVLKKVLRVRVRGFQRVFGYLLLCQSSYLKRILTKHQSRESIYYESFPIQAYKTPTSGSLVLRLVKVRWRILSTAPSALSPAWSRSASTSTSPHLTGLDETSTSSQ